MTTTIQPTVYELVLSCGHTQLATGSLPMGAKYPCWSACDPEKATPAVVLESKRYTPDDHTAFVVCSGLSNDDMLRTSRIADEMNTKPKVVENGTYNTIRNLLDELMNTSFTSGDNFLNTKIKIQMILALLRENDAKFAGISDTWRKLGTDGSLTTYLQAIEELKALVK